MPDSALKFTNRVQIASRKAAAGGFDDDESTLGCHPALNILSQKRFSLDKLK